MHRSKRRSLNALLLAMALATAGMAHGAPPRDGPASQVEPVGSVRIMRDLCYGEDRQQCLDVYTRDGSRAAPLIVMVHGGAWMFGDKAHDQVVKNKLAHWSQKGFVFVSVNYRMSRKPDPLQQAKDVATALSYVQRNAVRWGADPTRLVLVGHSAGAHLAAMINSSRALADAAGVARWKATVLLDSAALDVPAIMDAKHYDFYDRVFGSNRAAWEAASPFHLLASPPVPTLLVCSTKRSDSCPQARAYAAKVSGLGGRAQVLPVNLSHGAINDGLGESGELTTEVDRFIQSAD